MCVPAVGEAELMRCIYGHCERSSGAACRPSGPAGAPAGGPARTLEAAGVPGELQHLQAVQLGQRLHVRVSEAGAVLRLNEAQLGEVLEVGEGCEGHVGGAHVGLDGQRAEVGELRQCAQVALLQLLLGVVEDEDERLQEGELAVQLHDAGLELRTRQGGL